MVDQKDRVAFVTGAGRGIGRAIALALAGDGAQVAVTARTKDQLDSLVSEITAHGGRAMAFPGDLSDSNVPRQLITQVKEHFGPVDILVNNAGVGSSQNPKPVIDFDDDFWDLSLAVNMTAPYILCKAVLPDMIANHWGRIIMIASINSRTGSLHGAAYAASKHGLLGLSRSLAMEVAKDGITVNAICPGPVKTVLNDKRIAYDAERLGVEMADHEESLTRIGGRLLPAHIAPMAVYLSADHARMITGQAYNIDGGIEMS